MIDYNYILKLEEPKDLSASTIAEIILSLNNSLEEQNEFFNSQFKELQESIKIQSTQLNLPFQFTNEEVSAYKQSVQSSMEIELERMESKFLNIEKEAKKKIEGLMTEFSKNLTNLLKIKTSEFETECQNIQKKWELFS